MLRVQPSRMPHDDEATRCGRGYRLAGGIVLVFALDLDLDIDLEPSPFDHVHSAGDDRAAKLSAFFQYCSDHDHPGDDPGRLAKARSGGDESVHLVRLSQCV